MEKYPKLIPFKVGTSEFVDCPVHGTLASSVLTDEGTCSRCDRVCRGCGELRDEAALASALVGAGLLPNREHEHCGQKTGGFFMERQPCDHECSSNCRREGCNCRCGEYHEVEPPDAMLEAKDAPFNPRKY